MVLRSGTRVPGRSLSLLLKILPRTKRENQTTRLLPSPSHPPACCSDSTYLTDVQVLMIYLQWTALQSRINRKRWGTILKGRRPQTGAVRWMSCYFWNISKEQSYMSNLLSKTLCLCFWHGKLYYQRSKSLSSYTIFMCISLCLDGEEK